jgi:hypothetical protein
MRASVLFEQGGARTRFRALAAGELARGLIVF